MQPADDYTELLIRGLLQATEGDHRARQCALNVIGELRKAKAELQVADARLCAVGIKTTSESF